MNPDLFGKLTDSSSTQLLSPDEWPPFVQDMPAVEQVWGWRVDDERAVIDVIRSGGYRGPVFKANRWYLGRDEDGATWMQGTTGEYPDYGHHTDTLPAWPMREPPSQ